MQSKIRTLHFLHPGAPMFQGWEAQFRSKFANVRVDEAIRTPNFTMHTVIVGNRPVSESGVRELAFKYALDDLRDGLLDIKPDIGEQLRLKGI